MTTFLGKSLTKKKVFIASSRKFSQEVQKLIQLLEKKANVETAGKWNPEEKDTPESEKAALLRAFERINRSDILYVISKNGYIGKTVAMEIAYAYTKNKEIISSEEIEEFSARALVSKVLNEEELIKYIVS